MQNKLNLNQIEKVRERYHDHPLYVSCKRAFGHYETQTQRLLFAPEEMFLETSIILDKLLTKPDNAEQYVSDIWTELKRKIRYWDREAPQEDLDMIVGAIFFVTSATLCHHPHVYFNEEVKEALLSEARAQMGVSLEEEERFIVQLSLCAEVLDEWLMNYIECDTLLSEEILAIEKNKTGVGYQSVPHHFSLPNEYLKNNRLNKVLKLLKEGGYVHKNTKEKDWIFVCTGLGEEPDKPIQWLKDDDELGYFVQQFFNDKNKWARTEYCFLTKNGNGPDATNLRTNVTRKEKKIGPLYKIIHSK